MKDTYFITGIGTEVGKTIVSAIITETLGADYWKPVQAGTLDFTDTDTVKQLITNTRSEFHPSAFNLKTPASPHAAAAIEGIAISADTIERPRTSNTLVIEGAGGLLVPINDKETMLDLIKPTDKVIVVSRHYLGSINHTLLTISQLKQRKCNLFGLIFNGNENRSSESIISKMSGIPVLGRVEDESDFDKEVIRKYAALFKHNFKL